jgi:pimeloyl-ACP methyl ester carboxylesterase
MQDRTRRLIRGFRVALLGGLLWAAAGPAAAMTRDYVSLGRVAGVLTHPEGGPPPHVGIIYENGGSGPTSANCTELARRGFLTWCAIPPAQPASVGWESSALDVKAAMAFLRRQPGITAVVLYGHSGGGAIASFYQAVAENGVAFCQDPHKLSACDANLADLPRADAVVFPDAHPGLGVMDLRMINPSLILEGQKVRVDPALDPFSPANGFNPHGPSHYAPAFQQRYFAAQAAVMTRMIARAQAMKAGIAAGAIANPADKQVFQPGVGFANHLDELDPEVIVTTATRRPQRLLRNDGTIVTQPIHSVMVGHPEAAAMRNDTMASPAQFLSRGSVRARDSMTDVDWCSSNSVTVCNTRFIHVPVLFIPAGANNFIGDAERMFDASPATDKELVVVEGALHGGEPCVPCERTPGQYGNSQKNQFDYIAAWINRRFPAR